MCIIDILTNPSIAQVSHSANHISLLTIYTFALRAFTRAQTCAITCTSSRYVSTWAANFCGKKELFKNYRSHKREFSQAATLCPAHRLWVCMRTNKKKKKESRIKMQHVGLCSTQLCILASTSSVIILAYSLGFNLS